MTTIHIVATRVADFYGVAVSKLKTRAPLDNDSDASKAREVAIYLVDKYLKANIRERVAVFGQGNYNFIKPIREKIDTLIQTQPESEIPEAIAYLKEELGLTSAQTQATSSALDR